MKVLITGGNGFLGSKLKDRLIDAGFEVKTLSLSGCDFNFDITKKKNFEGLDNDFDVIFHLAGLILPFQSFSSPYSFFEVNSVGTLNVIDFALRNNSKVVFASTSKVYGKAASLPFKEDSALYPDSPYGYSKVLAEKLLESYSRFHGLRFAVLRFFNIYGPGQNENLLIPLILKKAKESDVIHLKGDIDAKRDFVFVDDVIEAMVKAVEAEGVFNIGSGKSYSARDLVSVVSGLIGKELSVETEMKEDLMKGAEDEFADIARAREKLKWVPRVSLEQGFKKMLE